MKYKILIQGWPETGEELSLQFKQKKEGYTNVVISWWGDKLLENYYCTASTFAEKCHAMNLLRTDVEEVV